MGAPHIHRTAEWDSYLRRKFPNNSNDKCLAGLRKKGYTGSADSMARHARHDLHLSKSKAYHDRERQRCIAICLARRGDDFPERQRQRALKEGWWGGRHHNGPSLPKEQLSAMAKRNFHSSKEVRDRAAGTRRKTVSRDRRRKDIGLDPLTRIHNLGEPMTRPQLNIRSQMKYECGYITFRFDKRIYYDDNTRRSSRREATAESRGVYVYHISQREKFKNEQ